MMKNLFRSFAVAAALLASPAVSSAQFVEDFQGPSNAWESGWLGTNSDLLNYYCGARGCTNRGSFNDYLWPFASAGMAVNFSPTFGATITQLTLDVSTFGVTNLQVFDMSNTMIYDQAVFVAASYSTGQTHSIGSSNGISRFAFTNAGLSGNLWIDNVAVNAVVATPEPASVVLIGTGLLSVLGVSVRRRSQRA
ncbi:hypothetical protein BH09GEM1_BH09GEM1_22760 [soil metagenome]